MSISRSNFFRPEQNYVALRLQQGVPLLDADWNELNDVVRHGVYEALNFVLPDGIQPGNSFPLSISSINNNDFVLRPGSALVRGRFVRVRREIRYSEQPWTDPNRAIRDEMDVISPLNTPEEDRQDIVYLDVWEREINPSELESDESEREILENRDIGLNITTCIRIKQEIAVRVEEGTTELPEPPEGHFFMPIAILNRPGGQASGGTSVDIRPRIQGTKGSRSISLPLIFQPIAGVAPSGVFVIANNWLSLIVDTQVNETVLPPTFIAVKRANLATSGILPLTVPLGARLRLIEVWGNARSTVQINADRRVSIRLLRSSTDSTVIETNREIAENPFSPNSEVLLQEVIQFRTSGTQFSGFFRRRTIPDSARQNVVDAEHFYSLELSCFDTALEVVIRGISLVYEY